MSEGLLHVAIGGDANWVTQLDTASARESRDELGIGFDGGDLLLHTPASGLPISHVASHGVQSLNTIAAAIGKGRWPARLKVLNASCQLARHRAAGNGCLRTTH